jgi:multidrug efflux system membrane fusion protein
MPAGGRLIAGSLRAAIAVLIVLGLLALVGALTWMWMSHARTAAPNPQQGRDAVVPVSLYTASTSDVPVTLEGVGTVKALNTVTVRPQIDGKIVEIDFKEGDEVKQGDVLAKLDPVTMKAQVDQAMAKKALDEALLANSQRDLDRFAKAGTLATTQQQLDTQKALVAQQAAQVKADQAAIDNVNAILAYANITSPISGRTGIRMVDAGNLVRASTDGIVVVAQIQPISVLFTLPEQDLAKIAAGMGKGQIAAEAVSTDGTTVLDKGTLQVVDNQVDTTTGTVRLKAEFPNTARQLWPGQFVTVRLVVDTLKQVVTVPTPAVQQGPNGPFVFVAGDDKTVAVRNVKVAMQTADISVISSGLATGDRVVGSGFGRLRDGARYVVPGAGAGQGMGTVQGGQAGADQAAAGKSVPDQAIASDAARASSRDAAAGSVGADQAKANGKHRHRKGTNGTDAQSGQTDASGANSATSSGTTP